MPAREWLACRTVNVVEAFTVSPTFQGMEFSIMFCRPLAISVAAAVGLSAGVTFAQTLPPAQPTSFDYNYYAQDTAASPSDAPAPAPAVAVPSVGCDAGCDSACSTCCDSACGGCDSCCSNSCGCGHSLFDCCCLGEPWTLFGENCCGITANGWAQFGFYTNEYGNSDNGPLGFNNEANGFQMHQLWLSVNKEAATDCCLDWGFGVDYVFGVDGEDTQAFGNLNGVGYDNEWDASSDYASALPQLYGTLGYNDWTVKLGHFYTLIGYEVVQATGNFFYSHSYSQYYGEPFTHTGVLASHDAGCGTAYHAGYVFGWDTGFDDGGDQSMFLGGISKELNDNVSIAWMLTAGDFGTGNGDLYMNSIVVTAQLTDRLQYIFQHDMGDQSGEGNANEWYSINQYLLYSMNDCWAFGGRFEWLRDDDGARVVPGTVGNYYEATFGLNYKPHANVIVRPELRFDWADVEAGALPYNGGTADEQTSGGLDIIFTF
ncbi:MAG: outer membrane beta-barrel protein [Planctomycetales bacterium]|nr:outer membrane beta-barrel protein [Planctomycetales bacterium]